MVAEAAVWRAAGRRFVGLLLLASAVIVGIAAPLALAVGASLSRAISLGFYGVGSVVLLLGFFVANRGPVRVKSDTSVGSVLPFVGERRVRWATPDEQAETINLSAVFVAIGLVLLAIGVGVDGAHELV